MSFFGEVIEPQSRAVWEDDDDLALNSFNYEREYPQLTWTHEKFNLSDIKLLLVVEGHHAVEFVESCLIDSSPINEIYGANVSMYSHLNGSMIICTCLNKNDNLAGEIAQLLQPLIDHSKHIITIQSLSYTYYRSYNKPDTFSLVRRLCTNSFKDVTNTPLLEQPNIIKGVSAGVVSLCEFLDKSGAVYLCYMDSPVSHTSSMDVQPLIDIFNYLKIPLQNFTPKIKIQSNLYL